MTRTCFVMTTAVLLAVSTPRGQSATDTAGGQLPVFSARSDLVVLQVTVTDRKSGLVRDLDRDAFTVYEEGRPQQITFFTSEAQPVSVGLVIDSSMSMARKRDALVAALLAFAKAGNPQDELFTVSFNERVRFGLPPGVPFTNNLGLLHLALNRIRPAGRTALYDALLASLGHLERANQSKKVLLLVSDGGDNASRARREDVVRQAGRNGAVIYAIALIDPRTDGADPGMLQDLALLTGGRAHFAYDAADVSAVLAEIAQEIRSSYTLGYAPDGDARDGRFHGVRVSVRAPGRQLIVRTRDGYVAGTGGLRP